MRGNIQINPKGMANSAVPSCASLMCRFCCMVGMREAKLEKPNPDTKKSAATAIRICLGEEVRGEIRDLIMNTHKNKEAD